MAKQYPDRTLEKALRQRGFDVVCHWQMKGPPNTMIAWMEYLFASNGEVGGGMIVQTFKEGGWSVYVAPTHKNDTETTIDAVIATLERKCT
jgi:hypothetical protein